MTMKKFIIGFVLAAAAIVGVVKFAGPMEVKVVETQTLVGGATGQDHLQPEYFKDGLYANKYFGLSTVNASTTSSTAPTLQLGSGAHGIITLGTSTPAIRIQNASTTAINDKSMLFAFQVSGSNLLPGVTCNTTSATGTMFGIHNHATSTNDGFSITVNEIPITNPYCFEYFIFDRSKAGY